MNIRRFLGLIFLVYAGLIFLVFMLVVSPFVVASAVAGQKKLAFAFLRIWAAAFSSLTFFRFGRRLAVEINPDQAHIYVGNHSSYLDAVAIVRCLPQEFSPLGKIEMTRIPVFGWMYRHMVVTIDRSSKESRECSVLRLQERLRQGESVLIFPEGTMNRGPDILLPFYDGAFRLAIETATPVLPFAILNSRKLLPRSDVLMLRPGLVSVIIGEPVPTAGLKLQDLPELKLRAEEQIRMMLRTKQV
ncbi:1-acyl-sn-glycerol-3-phosphate acyltransferase [Pedobacter sp. SYP-B3415]|uniref:lysophospholipid acyltransferase family protein n=1 Tax=Pedobacter sp. SYP-B3415 TaxID=2496641 RepID=UPI00101D9CB9|nr:lysophospholipid acyltransferase family protein [Pedobacter sp. SYP-B3415]